MVQAVPTPGNGEADGAMTTLPDVSVIVVNYNVRDFLAQALHAVERASSGLHVEVFVVDNNSVDGSVEMVMNDFPAVRLIRNDRNAGFGAANNQALRQARGRYLLILNPDTIVQEDTIRVLVDHLDTHPEAGAAGCQILNPDGSFAPESRRAYPTPRVAFHRIAGLSKLFPHSPVFGRYNMTFLPREQEAEVDALSGSCMLVRHAAIHVSHSTWGQLDSTVRSEVDHGRTTRLGAAGDGAGLFDEDFFMYGEDLDWCYRIQQAGWRIRYTPATRIVHYKGESTKKGELRYVRLFYGAMLHFIEKHFRTRYSRLFALMLRAGIMGRASLTLLRGAFLRLRPSIADFFIVYLCVAAVGLVRSELAGGALNLSFLLTVAPGYALAVVAGTAMSGGYRHARKRSARPVITGALAGLLVISTASFYVKDIAFSRVVVLLSFAIIVPLLVLRRWLGRGSSADMRRAVVVGSRSEAERLGRMLEGHPAPPFSLAGYVEPGPLEERNPHGSVPRLGSVSQLRDLVRLRRIDDVVFAAEGLPHTSTIGVMQQLRDLPVQFRMLVAGRGYVIGKASVEDLTLPALLEVDEPVRSERSSIGRRTFELSVAIPVLLFYPLLWAASGLTRRESLARRIVERARQAPAVIAGRRVIVGYRDPEDAAVAAPLGLRPAVFGIMESWPAGRKTGEDIGRAYCYYARNQSAALDCSIMLRSLKNGR